jgi:hypothetical protein
MSPATTMATASVGYQATGTGLEIETAACIVSHTHAHPVRVQATESKEKNRRVDSWRKLTIPDLIWSVSAVPRSLLSTSLCRGLCSLPISRREADGKRRGCKH